MDARDKAKIGTKSMLNMLAEKTVPQGIKPGLVAYCPTMDLIALVTRDEQTHVFRFNGQRVFGIARKKNDCSITQLRWKPNGLSFTTESGLYSSTKVPI